MEADNGPCQAWVVVLACILQSRGRGQEGVVEDNPESPLEKEACDILEEGSHNEHLEEDTVLDHHGEVRFWGGSHAEYDL